MVWGAKTSALPTWVTPEFYARTRAVWEPIYGRPLSDDEVTEILVNVSNLFPVLFNSSRRSPAGPPQPGAVRPRRRRVTSRKEM